MSYEERVARLESFDINHYQFVGSEQPRFFDANKVSYFSQMFSVFLFLCCSLLWMHYYIGLVQSEVLSASRSSMLFSIFVVDGERLILFLF